VSEGDKYQVTLTLRPPEWEWVDPRPVLFVCAVCERSIHENQWRQDGRSRNIAPICTHCEQAYGGHNLSSWVGHKMDARIARRGKALASFLECLANRQINERKYRGARL